jgi:SAM-dependent methyltransferase
MNYKRILYKLHPLRAQHRLKSFLQTHIGLKFFPRSETEKVRNLVINYCKGKGCDLGFGGDKIVKNNCDGIDYPQPYTKVGFDVVDIGCDIIKEDIPVDDNYYDYVYSSHLIEDFENTKEGLLKMIRVLKNRGLLILAFPDQKKYESISKKYGLYTNPYHKHKEMGMDFMIKNLDELNSFSYSVIFSSNCEIDYNVVLVLEITKQSV